MPVHFCTGNWNLIHCSFYSVSRQKVSPQQTNVTPRIRKRPRQQRSREQVARIFAATRRLLREQGVDAVTTVGIAKEAGVSVGSFYQYFPNKKAVLFALFDEYVVGLVTAAEKFENERRLALGWREFFTELFRTVKSAEIHDDVMREFADVIRLYPEMHVIDQHRGRGGVDFTVKHLIRLGAKGSRPYLEQLAWFAYELNSGIWLHQVRDGLKGQGLRQVIEWEITALLSVIATVFPDKNAAPTKRRR